MTKYYKSRDLDNPVVYVQEEGQWRGYAPSRGVLQQSAGPIPEVILAQTMEISRDQAETLIRIMRAEAERIEEGRAEVTRYPSNPSAPPRSRRPGWLVYALVGGAAAVMLVVVVVLATIEGFGDGPGLAVTQTGATQTASTGVPGVPPADVVATVAGTSISKRQFDQRVADFEAQYAGQIPDKKSAPDRYKLFRQDVLEYMITYELASQKAQQLSITVTDQDVQTQIDTILKVSFSGDQIKFDDALKQQGITMDQFKQSYKESTLFQKVYDEVTKDVTTVPDSTLLDAKQKEAWQEWIEQAKAASGVTYADGWKPTATTGTILP